MKKIIVAFCCFGHLCAFGQTLSLNEYLNAVRDGNDDLNATSIRIKAFKEVEAEANLLYSAQLQASGSYTDDKRPTTSAAFQGNQTKLKSGMLGLVKNTSYGTSMSVSYNVSETEINGASPSLVPQNSFYENYAKAEFSQSLIRNALGSEINARAELLKKSAKGRSLSQEFLTKTLLSEAENLYFQLLISIDSENIQKDSLERAKSIEKYTKSKLKKNLGDKTDYLQAKAALKQRQFEYQMAKDETRRISQLFNSFIGVDSPVLSKRPIEGELKNLLSFNFNNRAEYRLDTLASESNLAAELAQQKLNVEALKPDLKLNASASFYGRRVDLDGTVGDSLSSNNPVYTVGISFTMPMDFRARKKAEGAYRASIIAAQKEYKRIVFEERNNWENLKRQFHEIKRQVEILEDLVVIQKEKLDNEKRQQKRGRSTTFQVLTFEQEYLSAQLRKIQLKSNLANVYSQLKTYL